MRWNSTYDMMKFVVAYRPAIDKITADKALKLRKYKLDNHLNSSMKRSYHPAILAAMKLACNKINRYYSMTDLSSAYRIAMGKCRFFFHVIIIHY